MAVAAAPSLKTLLSRWENGHSVPEPQYRDLLAELYGRSAGELGLILETPPESAAERSLAAALAAASAGGDRVRQLWQQQLVLARELDDTTGAAGSGALVTALVERLADTLLHTVPAAARSELAAVLSSAAALAGDQALDLVRPDRAWRHYDQARQAAREAELPEAAAVATVGLAMTLIEVGEPGWAVQLLSQSPAPPAHVQARLQLAMALARAAAGEPEPSRAAVAAAARALWATPVDIVDRRDAAPVELSDLHRWQGRVLVELADPGAIAPLEQALAAGSRSARQRAAVHADLALALRGEQPQRATEHARSARELAAGIGSERIPARLARWGGAG